MIILENTVSVLAKTLLNDLDTRKNGLDEDLVELYQSIQNFLKR